MSIRKRLLPLVLTVAVLLGVASVPAFATQTGATDTPAFSDMPDDWSTAALQNAVANGLLEGENGKIMPNDPLTRAQMAAVITRAFGAEVPGNISAFSDVKAGDWYADSIAKAYQMGVLKGSDGRMNPQNAITRQEVFAILARAFKLQPAGSMAKEFSDADQISDWARSEVYALVNAGYIQGDDGRLNPTGLITRAQFAQVFDNIVKQYIRTAGEYTQVAAGNVMINVPGVTLKNLTVSGDLIIGDGVGDGDVVLDNVKVTGRMVVRGGGENSIIIRGSSSVGSVIVSRTDGAVSIKVQGGADVEVIYIDDGSDDVIVQGTVGSVEIQAPGVTVNAAGATIGSVDIAAANVNLVVDAGSRVGSVDVFPGATGSDIQVSGRVDTVTTNAPDTTVTGSGTVTQVKALAGADNSKIETPKTQITVGDGVNGVTGGGGTAVEGGSTVNNNDNGTGVTTTPPSGGGGDGPSKPALNVSAAKLETAPDDTNQADSQANQDAVTVTKSGKTITISGPLSALKSFDSTNPTQGEHKWIGLVIDTGESSIIGVSYNGAALTQADVDEAASVGVEAGKFVLWVKADALVEANKTFTLAKSGKTSVTITIQFHITLAESDILGEASTPTKAELTAYLNGLFTFSGAGTINWNDSSDTLTVAGYTVAHDKDSETDTASSAWTIWTGRVMDGFSLDLSDVTAFILAPDSWLHIQSAATLTLPADAILTLNGGVITKDGTDTAWGYKQNGDPKYFDVLKGSLPAYSYEEGRTGYPAPTAVDLVDLLSDKTQAFFTEFYNKTPSSVEVTIDDSNKDAYFVEIGAYSGAENPETATLGGTAYSSSDTYLISVGKNRFIDHNIWVIEDGTLYVALPYLCVETMPDTALTIRVGGQRFEVTTYDAEIGTLAIDSVDPLGPENGYKNEAEFDGNTVTHTTEHRALYVGVKLKAGDEVLGTDVFVFRKNLADNSVGITEPEISGHTYAVYGSYADAPVSEESTINRSFRLAVPGKGIIDIDFEFIFEVKS